MEIRSDIVVKSTSEFFIAVAAQGIHSFMMLGVMDRDNFPRLLARVGKTNDIDPTRQIDGSITREFATIVKEIGKKGALARIGGEWLDYQADIHYQAYAVDFRQAKEFLALIHSIEQKHIADPIIGPAIELADVRNRRIECYIPTSVTDGKVTFTYKALETAADPTFGEPIRPANPDLIARAQQIKVGNTCRTTSLNVAECILGFKPDVSEFFLFKPKYQTKLIIGGLEEDTFYILPPPPEAYNHGSNLSKHQISVLKKLYERLEDIPKIQPGDRKTRVKFNKLKIMYNDIAGNNNLSVNALLGKIAQHENGSEHDLFDKRAPNFFSWLFRRISTTERFFRSMKKELEPLKESDLVPGESTTRGKPKKE